jgi:N-acetylneuraminic acid mutarotase
MKMRGLFFCLAVISGFLLIACNGIYAEDKEAVAEGRQSTGTWIWVSGDSTANRAGLYGVQGAAASANKPGARDNCISWIDSAGSMWLFGGEGYDTRGIYEGLLNDLWKFDGANWTWVSGGKTANQHGVYGVKGVAAATNKPGARDNSISWIDKTGNLWLFGGSGVYSKEARGSKGKASRGSNSKKARGGNDKEAGRSNDDESPGNNDKELQQGLLNDLWKFDGTNWTWVSGDDNINQVGIYGAKGVAAAANKPGARDNSICWIDNAGSLWLFGGNAIDAEGIQGYLNDLWKFDGTNWTWISGDSTVNKPGIYGAKGVAAEANKPEGRCGSVSWIDKAGNLWLFGGIGIDGTGAQGYLNDLWKFDGRNWTWVSGDNTVGQAGVYGAKGVPSATNKPGSRENCASWIDSSGNLWLFGGNGFNVTGLRGWLNDLWKFDGANWTWVSGTSSANGNGAYGAIGVALEMNKPGAREGSASWEDSTGNLWLFGGNGYDGAGTQGSLNDLWKFMP